MASWVSYPLFTNIVVALSVNIIIVFLFPTLPNLVKSPSHPKDVQPVLPRQVSQPIPEYPYGPEKLSPVLVGVINAKTPLKWEGSCFKESTAHLQLHDTSGTAILEVCISKLLFYMVLLGFGIWTMSRYYAIYAVLCLDMVFSFSRLGKNYSEELFCYVLSAWETKVSCMWRSLLFCNFRKSAMGFLC